MNCHVDRKSDQEEKSSCAGNSEHYYDLGSAGPANNDFLDQWHRLNHSVKSRDMMSANDTTSLKNVAGLETRNNSNSQTPGVLF
jgi:hypothetical protein